MDVIALLKGVKNLDNYVAVTQDLAYKYKNAKIECNMSMVLTLKSIRSLEIEYFNIRDDNGAAIIVFERLLVLPPSKAWNMLGKELVALIEYWLDKIRNDLLNHHPHWWSFVKRLLKFVKVLIKKDHALHTILVKDTADCFLDLATRSRLDLSQRHAVLYTFNIICAESSKEIRCALRNEFKHYFIRLATIMATCGHFPTQYSITETLLRWLVPRRDPAERRDAANKWFPPHLYSRQAVQVFIDRPWENFHQDARDFLNAHNEMSGLVTSVVCSKLTVGDEVLVSIADRRPTWLDINESEGCVSVQLEPAAGDGGRVASETLTVAGDTTLAATLCRKSMEVTIILETSEPPQLFPSDGHLLGAGKQLVQVVISSRSDMARVDNALRAVFLDNYEVLLDFENMILSPTLPGLSRDNNTKCPHTAEDAKPRNQSGYKTLRSAKPVSFKSPSTTSTTSLAQLRDKLTAQPPFIYKNKYLRVSVKPDLSVVTDLTETSKRSDDDIPNSHDYDTDSTLQLRPCGVLIKSVRNQLRDTNKSLCDSDIAEEKANNSASRFSDLNNQGSDTCTISNTKDTRNIAENRKSYGDNLKKNVKSIISEENLNVKPRCGVSNTSIRNYQSDAKKSQSDSDIAGEKTENTKSHFSDTDHKGNKNISEEKLNQKLDSNSLTAFVINDTLERLSQIKNDYSSDRMLIDLLLKEALQSKNCIDDNRLRDSGINTGDGKKSQDFVEAIENAPNAEPNIPFPDVRSNKIDKTKCNIISKSTSNESNTEAIIDTPVSYVSIRKRNQRKIFLRRSCEQNTEDAEKVPPVNDNFALDVQSVENYFAQHFTENKACDLIVSPTLVKKINVTSSESSDDFDQCLISNENDVNIEQYELPNIEIIECLNDIVDKICDDFDKCTGYLGQGDKIYTMDITENRKDATYKTTRQDSGNTNKQSKNTKMIKGKGSLRSKQSVKLNFLELKTPDVTKSNKNLTTKIQIKPSVMSPITEVHNEVSDIVKYSSPQTPRKNEVDNKLLRRKRKLYSPKDDYVIPDNENQIDADLNILSDNQNDLPLSEIRKSAVTPKSTIASYKEFENEPIKYKRLRSRKSKGKVIQSPILSPKTKKNNFEFDKLKENIDTRVKITLAAKACDNDIAIYNFTSDSDDEDFKNKKNELQKRISTTTVDSGNSFISTRRGKIRKVDHVESNTAKNKTSTAKRKRPAKRGNVKSSARAVNVNPVIELEDETIRDAIQEELNTSLLIENPKKNIECEELNPAILAPQVELIIENDVHKVIKKMNQTIAEKKKSTKKIEKTIKKKRAVKHIEAEDKCGDRTISPLPGLIVETAPTVQKEADDSLTSNMLQKMKKLYQEGPDAVNDISISNTTHNLLPNAERTNLNVQIINDELNDIIGDDSFRHEDVIVDKKETSFYAKNNPKEKALFKICDIENVNSKSNVKSNDEIGEINSLRDVKITKNPPKKRTLQLKSKKKVYKSTEKDVTATEKSQTSPVLLNNVVEGNKENKYAEKSPKRIDTTNRSIDIFCIDDSNISNKIHSKLASKPIETIAILDTVTEMKSEKSIATVGITGHGDVSEKPPCLKALNEIFVPRELVDMNDSSKEYYVKLHKNINDWNDFLSDNNFNVEFNDSINGRNESSNTSVQGTDRKVTSPKKRSDGISKLISKHKSEKSMKVTQESKSLYDYSKWLPSNKNSDSETLESSEVSKSVKKSPVVCIQRLSDEVFKLFPMNDYNVSIQKHTNLASNYEKYHKEKKANKEGINTSLKGFNKRLTTIPFSVSEASDSNKVSKSRKSPILCFERLFSDLSKFRNNNNDSLEKNPIASNYDKYPKKNEAKSINNTSPKDSSERLSIISPRDSDSEASDNTEVSKNNKSPVLSIKILPRDLFRRTIDSPYYNKNPKGKELKSRNDTSPKDFSKRLSIISPIKLYGDEETTRTKRKFQDDSSEDVTVKRNKNTSSKSYQSVVKTPPQITYFLRNIPQRSIDTSPDSILSSSTRLNTSRTADKHVSSKGAKTRKPDDSNTGQEGVCGDSEQSLSCVEDWLQTQPAPNRDQNLIDVLQNVMEKLDTTLVENRNNSHKKLIMSLFVWIHKRTSDIHKMIEKEFESLMKEMKERTVEFIRDDCNKNRVMVSVIRDDLQAVINSLGRKT